MVEADVDRSARAERWLQPLNWSVRFHQMRVTPGNAETLTRIAETLTPDFLSVDIDGNDYHVVQALLAAGFRPQVVCVEFNSAFGPTRKVTIPYIQDFDYLVAHPSGLYYGASVAAWRGLLEPKGYRFVTVDSRGVNAFFVGPSVALPESVHGLDFAENTTQRLRASC
jgi:hypothetical protein